MDTEYGANNKRIARNTLFLYLRLFIKLIISLYTSRILLSTIGVVDYGIYNVIGSVVAVIGVLNGTMDTTMLRFFTYELGKDDLAKLTNTFSSVFVICVLLGLLLLTLAETIGVYIVNSFLTIPKERLSAANIIIHFIAISAIVHLLSSPYRNIVLAHEDMNVYAYISIMEAIISLLLVYCINLFNYDNLILYSGFVMLLSIGIGLSYYIYCRRKYYECRLCLIRDNNLYKVITAYSGWNLFGSVANVAQSHGLSVVQNMFFGPLVNTAQGIATQISALGNNLYANFYTAVKPQITKYYAKGEKDNMIGLSFASSKFSFFLLLLVSMPIAIEAPTIVRLWLGQVPDYVVSFTRIIVIISAINSLSYPLMTIAHATGKIAVYQTVVGTMRFLNLPIALLVLRAGGSPISVFLTVLVVDTTSLFLRLWVVRRLVSFPIFSYIREVLCRVFFTAAVSLLIPIIYHLYLSTTLLSVFFNCILCVVSLIIAVLLFGLKDVERCYLIDSVTRIIRR